MDVSLVETRSHTNRSWSEVNGNIWRQKPCYKWERKSTKNPYNKFLINFVCSVLIEKYLPSAFSLRPHFFVAQSVRQHQANTFPYVRRSRLTILHYYIANAISSEIVHYDWPRRSHWQSLLSRNGSVQFTVKSANLWSLFFPTTTCCFDLLVYFSV